MKPITVFSSKAQTYDKYRWDYAPEAVQAIRKITQLSRQSSLADLGAGTGMLTQHFLGIAGHVYAVEPNPEMRAILAQKLGSQPSVTVLDANAEHTTLPDRCVNVITVAQALHWFEPEAAKTEIQRVLKPNGWLAVLENIRTNEQLTQETESLMTEAYGADFSATRKYRKDKPLSFYFGHESYQCLTYPFAFKQDWDGFIGAILSASFMPDEHHPLYTRLVEDARKVFERHSQGNFLTVNGTTQLFIDKIFNSRKDFDK